jgi:hypothetical protein
MPLRYLPRRAVYFIWARITHVFHCKIMQGEYVGRNYYAPRAERTLCVNTPHYSLEYQSHNCSVVPLATTTGFYASTSNMTGDKMTGNLQIPPLIGSTQCRSWVKGYESYGHIMPMCVAWVILGSLVIDHDCFGDDIDSPQTKVWLTIINIWWEKS